MVPDDEKSPRSFKFSVTFLRFLIVLLFAVAVAVVFGAATYWQVASLALDYNRLFEENEKLKENLARVEQLEKDIEKVKLMDQKLRNSLSGYVKILESENIQNSQVRTGGLLTLRNQGC